MSTLLRILPHAVALVVFTLVSSVFFAPAYDGYDLRQGDIAQFKGMSKEIVDYRDLYGAEPLWTSSMFSGMPAYQISVIQSRNVPQLIQLSFRKLFPGPVGMLVLAMLSFYVLGLCLRVNPWLAMVVAIGFGLSTVHILYLGAGHMSKVNAIALMPGVVGGVLLAFRGKALQGAAVTLLFLAMHLAANHLQMTYYLMFLVGFIVVGELVRLAMAKQLASGLRTAAWLVMAAGLAILPNLTNIITTYEYSAYTTRGKTELTLPVPGRETDDTKTEGLAKSYMLEYSMSRDEFWSMLIPNAKGGATAQIGNDTELLQGIGRDYYENVAQSKRYWGDQLFTGGAFYFGALLMALFIIALFALKDVLRWVFLALTILAVMLSWKDPNFIGNFFIDHVPLYDKFRDTKMVLVVVSVMAPTLAMLLLQRLIDGNTVARTWLTAGVGAVVLLMLLFIAAPGSLFDFISSEERANFGQYLTEADANTQRYIKGFMEALETVRQSIFRADALRSLLFVLVAAALALALDRRWLKAPVAIVALGVFILGDLYPVNRRYMNDEQQGRQYVHWQPRIEKAFPQPAGMADQFIYDREIAQRSELLKEVNAFVAEQLDDADDLLGDVTRNEREEYTNRIRMAAQTAVLRMNTNYRVLNLHNSFNDVRTSYYHRSLGGYHGAKLRRYQEVIDFHLTPEIERFMSTAQAVGINALANAPVINMLNTRYLIVDPNGEPIENPFANGAAWFVSDLDRVATADEEVEAMENFDSAYEAIVNTRFADLLPTTIVPDSAATIVNTDALPNYLRYTTESSTEQFAVFSEIYYPEGWQAYLDGTAVDHVCVNYILRGMKVPAGSHVIEFKFEPASYGLGQQLAGAGSALFVLAMLGALFMAWRRRNADEATE